MDLDRLSFELREIDGTARTQKFVFEKEILDDILQAIHSSRKV